MYHSTTIAAIATPSGPGAIGVIRLSGADTFRVMDAVFRGGKLSEAATHTAHFGTIRDGSQVLDEVLVTIFRNPRSYTGEDVAEISCHGSPYILQSVLELLVRQGAQLAKPGEFTLRAFLNGKMDLSQAEAVADLIASESESAHRTALQQMRGGFSGEIKQLREQLIHFASLVELELDFSEEDVEFADRRQLTTLIERLQQVISALMRSFHLGNVIKKGVTTVIAGRPNAGKSTLLNALLKEERAIVSDIPGTTRDTIEEVINIDGLQFRLIDTAGIRDAVDKIEAIGVNKTMEKIRESSLVVYVFDAAALSPEELRQDLEKLNSPTKVILVGNKVDEVEEATVQQQFGAFEDVVFLSAKNHAHLERLHEALLAAFDAGHWKEENTIVTSTRHYEALLRAQEALGLVMEGMDIHVSGELLALDIRTALDALGEITGEITTDDLLGNIFSKFCIGK